VVPGHPVTNNTAVIIFTKAPIPGTVKTRLCHPLTADEAASLHGSLVLDTIERTKGLTGTTLYVAGAPDVEHPFFKVLEGHYGARLLEQRGGDLGSRIHLAIMDVFALGHPGAILIGTDLPALQRAHLQQACDLLRTHVLVLGPTQDGGYYLIGLQRPAPELFDEIRWSGPTVFEETRKKAESLGMSVGLLPECRDLDDLEDLKAFIQMTGQDKNLSKRTADTLKLLGKRLKERSL
jgi:rSAM/selenodomain-associated transferase 1